MNLKDKQKVSLIFGSKPYIWPSKYEASWNFYRHEEVVNREENLVFLKLMLLAVNTDNINACVYFKIMQKLCIDASN